MEIRQRGILGDDLRRATKTGHQFSERLLNLQNHARAALRHEWNIAAELDCVAKTLLSVHKNGLPRDFALSRPSRLRETALDIRQLLGLPSPFIVFPAVIKVAEQKSGLCFAKVRFGMVRRSRMGALKTRYRLIEAPYTKTQKR